VREGRKLLQDAVLEDDGRVGTLLGSYRAEHLGLAKPNDIFKFL
jgi:hypothetical protein